MNTMEVRARTGKTRVACDVGRRWMKRSLRVIHAFLLLLAASGMSGHALCAGDPVAGQALFAANCSGCHWASPAPSSLVASAAGAPELLADHLVDLAEMGRPLRLVPPQLADIAAYLANVLNHEGLWWNASESGWGINVVHEGDVIFATWFTYDLSGKGRWVAMIAPQSAPGTYSGTLYTTTGPAFDAVPFDSAQVATTPVGAATLAFSGGDSASFAYTLDGISQTKTMTRHTFGQLPSCMKADGDLASANNYQDLWWAAPAGSESGWGINFTHQSDTIVATWFTYDADHTPMWLVATASRSAPGVYAGTLYRATGPAFNAMPFAPAGVVASAVGSTTLTFRDGNDATFAYTVNGVSQTKAITRAVFRAPGTVCR